MALSEFRYNKKRKHFSYIFGRKGNLRKNLLLTSKPIKKIKRKKGKYIEKKNVKLYQNPDPNDYSDSYVIPKVYCDDESSFGRLKSNWRFHTYDRLVIKKIKRGKW